MRKIALCLCLSLINFPTAWASFDSFELKSGRLPDGISPLQVERVVERIERRLEYKMQRVPLHVYSTQEAFLQAMAQGRTAVLAFTRPRDQSVHLGPRISKDNFEDILGHEIVHVIFQQKYKGRIPAWLEEGFATQLGSRQPPQNIDYSRLKREAPGRSVGDFSHPLRAATLQDLDFAYRGSLALVQMIDHRCPSVQEVLSMSLQRELTDVLKTFCNIDSVDMAFQKWLSEKDK